MLIKKYKLWNIRTHQNPSSIYVNTKHKDNAFKSMNIKGLSKRINTNSQKWINVIVKNVREAASSLLAPPCLVRRNAGFWLTPPASDTLGNSSEKLRGGVGRTRPTPPASVWDWDGRQPKADASSPEGTSAKLEPPAATCIDILDFPWYFMSLLVYV